LLTCARSPALAEALKGSSLPQPLNGLAWGLAIDKAASPHCLLKAEEAVDTALQQIPENLAYLDTKATVLFRQGRLDEAIDLERGAVVSGEPLVFSQLDRFLRARQAGGGPLLLGEATPTAKLSLGPRDAAGRRELVVELGSAFPQGLVLYARETDSGGLLEFAVGATQEQTYRLSLPAGIRDQARFELALLDARGCDECTGGGWHWRFVRHVAEVDKYP
jgi:hypothetical protein